MKICRLIFCVLLLTGCASKKKSVQTVETVSIEAAKTELQHTDVIRMIDTTRTESGRVTVTEVDFFSPVDVVGTAFTIAHSVTPAIKSIRKTIIETQTQTRGESTETISKLTAINENVALDSETVVKTEVTPAPDPKRWRYIFYILLIIVGVVLYLKRGKIWKWAKTVFR